MSRLREERGATATLVALSLFFLIAAAALAVDISGFYGDARSNQTSADLACLAGVAELPDQAAAMTAAAANAQINYPEMAGQNLVTLTSTTSALYDGSGSTITFETNYGGDPRKMRVVVAESSDGQFSPVLGAESVTVRQLAVCEGSPTIGAAGVPMGIVAGGFGGGLFGPNPCGSSSGNCGGLSIGGNGSSVFEDNVANGIPVILAKHHGNAGTHDADNGMTATDCDTVSSGDACNLIDTKTGEMAGPLGQGLIRRLRDDPGATCTFTYRGNSINCDTPATVIESPGEMLESLWSAFGSKPTFWEDSIFGAWTEDNAAHHYYYNAVVAKCDSPRRTVVPVLDDNDDWDIGDSPSGWPTGSSSQVKVIAMVDAILIDPNDTDDFQGNSNAKHVSAVIVWYGPDATCTDGSPVGLNNDSPTAKVRLISG